MRTTPSAHEKSGECKHKDYVGKKNLQGTEMHATNPPLISEGTELTVGTITPSPNQCSSTTQSRFCAGL